MTTKYKVNFDEQTKGVTVDVTVESDVLTADQVLEETLRLTRLALEESRKLTLKKVI